MVVGPTVSESWYFPGCGCGPLGSAGCHWDAHIPAMQRVSVDSAASTQSCLLLISLHSGGAAAPQFANYTPYIILSIISVDASPSHGALGQSGRQAGSVLYNLAAPERKQSCGGSFHSLSLSRPYISRAAGTTPDPTLRKM